MRGDRNRRDFARLSAASAIGWSASGWLPRVAAAAGPKPKGACIVLWMSGGPSQTDTFDLKPGHKNGGPFKEIAAAVPGMRISEHLPKLAALGKELAIVRSMSTKEGEHMRATTLLHTGQLPNDALKYPALGSMLGKELGHVDHDLPSYVSIAQGPFGTDLGAGFLGPQYAPLAVSGLSDNPNARANLTVEGLSGPAGVGADALAARRRLLAEMQKGFAERYESAATAAHAAGYRKAQRMIDTQGLGAFKLEEEKDKLRDAYGRNRFGQGCLLARRLVERGVPFVEVTLDGWDTHANNFDAVKTLSGTLDGGFATLLADLKDRGLLASTMVVWMGEFGRTPLINRTNGRDHFAAAWSTVLAGGKVKGGQIVGASSKDGTTVANRPVSVGDLLSTVCAAVGIDPKHENLAPDGRPLMLVKDGAPIKEIVG